MREKAKIKSVNGWYVSHYGEGHELVTDCGPFDNFQEAREYSVRNKLAEKNGTYCVYGQIKYENNKH